MDLLFFLTYMFVLTGVFVVIEFVWRATRMTFLTKELISAGWALLNWTLFALLGLFAFGPILFVEMMAVSFVLLGVFFASQALFVRFALRQSMREYCASRDAESEEWRRQRAAKKAGARSGRRMTEGSN